MLQMLYMYMWKLLLNIRGWNGIDMVGKTKSASSQRWHMARQCRKTLNADDTIIAILEDTYGVDLDGASDRLITQGQTPVQLAV